MCGIAGIVVAEGGGGRGGAPRLRPQVERMVAALRHRGPDARGVMEFPGAVLGHARLSIVDLAGGAQPMRSAVDTAVAVTFNGEIYGYRKLREELAAGAGGGKGGYPFRTQSDTEILLAMYHRNGGRFVEGLPGMFAFALWDERAHTLTAARDRFGEKPLYYALFDCEGVQGLVFASELKALLASGLVAGRLNQDALAHYLQYLYVHPYQTIYENVSVLPPGHRLTYREGELSIDRYWELPATRGELGMEAAVEELRHLLKQAVERQLVADVPVGAFLSGGLDSATVVAVAAGMRRGLETFAFRFAAGGMDETPYAEEVARMHGTAHHVLDDERAELGGLLEEMAAVYDEPFGDSSNIPTYLVSKLARRHLKVVLTGDGGDELLAGYAWYRALAGVPIGGSVTAARLKQSQYFSDETLGRFGLRPSAMPKFGGASGTVDDAMRMDLQDYMPGDILVKIDRASMAHGLELRAPFLDVDLASFLIGLPPRLKMDGETDKVLLRRAFSELWPASVRTRSKQGFGAPVGEWLLRPDVAPLVSTRLEDARHPVFSLVPFETSRIAVERRNYQTWALLVLALWLERHPL